MDEEYEGDYSIERQISILPLYDNPHLSISCEGRLDQPGCDLLRYAITIINDGNMDLGPVNVRDTIPSGTGFIDASLQPFNLESRYAEWSIPLIGMGTSVTIEVDLQINTRRDNYTNRATAQTVYQYERRGIIRDIRLRASDSSLLEVDWTDCNPQQNMSASFRATSNADQPRILTYRLTVQNLAEEDMKVDMTTLLPKDMSFINSTYPTSEISEDQIAWKIDKLSPGRRRSISFMTEAKEDGLFPMDLHGLGKQIAGVNQILNGIDGHDQTAVHILPPAHVSHNRIAGESQMSQDGLEVKCEGETGAAEVVSCVVFHNFKREF